MSVTLYRKYRPNTFESVIGQDRVVHALRSMLEKKKVGHAFIFSGGRGTGKTTIARIFAQELGVTDKDLYEIDAASYTGVDNIRELRDGVATAPFESPYKVYILDEAHMLSRAASNALLKTLEEPPAHCIFMLATTDLDKILDTVISRCEVYTLEQPTLDMLATVVKDIAKKEGYTLLPEHAEAIAFVGDGSYRNALSVLQQVLAATDGKTVSEDAVVAITRTPSHAHVIALVRALATSSIDEALTVIENVRTSQTSAVLVGQRVLDMIRKVIVYAHAPSLRAHVEGSTSAEEYNAIRSLAESKDATIQSFISSKTLMTTLSALQGLARSSRPDVLLEALCLELCQK